jgi:hypothetical protein
MLVLVNDDLDRLTLQRLRLSHLVLARLHAASLDQRLASGADPESDPLLAARAMRLTSPRFRRGLATSLRRVLTDVRPAAAFRPRHDQVSRAAAELAELPEYLLAPQPVPVRGVALVTRLLSEGNGPLYRKCEPDALRDAALQAAAALAG